MKTLIAPLHLALLTAAFVIQHSSFVIAQGGSLTPPGAPAPTMRSLQEIWDKVGALETQVTGLESQTSLLQSQNAQLQRQLGLLAASTVNFAWVLSTVATGQGPSLAFGPDGQPAIAYWVQSAGIHFAQFDGTTWTSVPVPGTSGASPSLAFGQDGYPAIAYSGTGGSLHIARFDGASWSVTVVDSEPGAGYLPTLRFGPDGLPGIAYRRLVSGSSAAKYAAFDGLAWTPSTIETGSSVANISFALGPDGQPAVIYRTYNNLGGTVKMARPNGLGGWTITTAATEQSYFAGEGNAIAFGPDGQPAVAYSDGIAERIYVTRYNGSIWTPVTVTVGTDSDFMSLTFGPDGQPALAFQSKAQDLLFYRYVGSLDGPAWGGGTAVESAGNVGSYCSLAYGPDGQPAIAYGDETNSGARLIKFARKGVFKTGP